MKTDECMHTETGVKGENKEDLVLPEKTVTKPNIEVYAEEPIQDKDICKIDLHFTDGTTQTIDKGFICGFERDYEEDTATAKMHFVNVDATDLYTVVMLVMELAVKLNMFGVKEEDVVGEES